MAQRPDGSYEFGDHDGFNPKFHQLQAEQRRQQEQQAQAAATLRNKNATNFTPTTTYVPSHGGETINISLTGCFTVAVTTVCLGLALYYLPTLEHSIKSYILALHPPQPLESDPVNQHPNASRIAELKPYPQEAATEQLRMVKAFYGALGKPDGLAASSFMIYKSQSVRATTAKRLDTFFSKAKRPLQLDSTKALTEYLVQATYSFVGPNGTECNGLAYVTVSRSGGEWLISNIHANC